MQLCTFALAFDLIVEPVCRRVYLGPTVLNQ
jgi:hypothetical protein